MHACVSIPHKMTDFKLEDSFICSVTSGIIIEKHFFAWAGIPNFSSSISGTVGPRPLGYCSVANVGTRSKVTFCMHLSLAHAHVLLDII